MLSEKIKNKIGSADNKLNLLHGWESNSVNGYISELIKNKKVEVGYRSQCGATHLTHKIYKEFYSVVKMLRKEGFEISEEYVKHNNGYATINQGFWNSTIFILT